jgi:hypothetical protein
MIRLALLTALFATAASAADLDVPLNGRAVIKTRKAIAQIEVRDPAMLTVIKSDGVVSLEGKESGVTGVKVTYADGEIEETLVIVGTAKPTKGPRMEHSKTVDLNVLDSATANAKQPAPDDLKAKEQKSKDKAAVNDASDVVRAAVEAL